MQKINYKCCNIYLSLWETRSSKRYANNKKYNISKTELYMHRTNFNRWLCIFWQTFTLSLSRSYFFFMHARYVLQIFVCIYNTQSAMRFARVMTWTLFRFTYIDCEAIVVLRLKRARKNTLKWKMCVIIIKIKL